MQENKKVLGKVDLVAVLCSGTNKEGKDYSFTRYAIKIGDVEIGINARNEDKSLFDYKLGNLDK